MKNVIAAVALLLGLAGCSGMDWQGVSHLLDFAAGGVLDAGISSARRTTPAVPVPTCTFEKGRIEYGNKAAETCAERGGKVGVFS